MTAAQVHPSAFVEVREGASLVLGEDVRVGERCRIVCHEHIAVGAGAVLEDEVVLTDLDQVFDDVDVPVRLQALRTAPVSIGARAVLRKGAVVLPGVTVGDGAEVSHHAVVTHDVPAGARVDGVPARVVGRSGGGGECRGFDGSVG